MTDEIDPAHQAYADQVEECVRQLGRSTTAQLVQLLPATPAMEYARTHRHGSSTSYSAKLSQRWLSPYLRLLVSQGKIGQISVTGVWEAKTERCPGPKVRVDPLASDTADDQRTESDGGPTG